jgi:hypothetical protein
MAASQKQYDTVQNVQDLFGQVAAVAQSLNSVRAYVASLLTWFFGSLSRALSSSFSEVLSLLAVARCNLRVDH